MRRLVLVLLPVLEGSAIFENEDDFLRRLRFPSHPAFGCDGNKIQIQGQRPAFIPAWGIAPGIWFGSGVQGLRI